LCPIISFLASSMCCSTHGKFADGACDSYRCVLWHCDGCD
jgi:hypothetical protein